MDDGVKEDPTQVPGRVGKIKFFVSCNLYFQFVSPWYLRTPSYRPPEEEFLATGTVSSPLASPMEAVNPLLNQLKSQSLNFTEIGNQANNYFSAALSAFAETKKEMAHNDPWRTLIGSLRSWLLEHLSCVTNQCSLQMQWLPQSTSSHQMSFQGFGKRSIVFSQKNRKKSNDDLKYLVTSYPPYLCQLFIVFLNISLILPLIHKRFMNNSLLILESCPESLSYQIRMKYKNALTKKSWISSFSKKKKRPEISNMYIFHPQMNCQLGPLEQWTIEEEMQGVTSQKYQ